MSVYDPNEPCNCTYGPARCTEPVGHKGDHWDQRTEHEWSREDDD